VTPATPGSGPSRKSFEESIDDFEDRLRQVRKERGELQWRRAAKQKDRPNLGEVLKAHIKKKFTIICQAGLVTDE
jgi:hypothetical protein